MSRALKVAALSGGTYRPSGTLVLTQAVLAELAQTRPSKATALLGAHPTPLLKIA